MNRTLASALALALPLAAAPVLIPTVFAQTAAAESAAPPFAPREAWGAAPERPELMRPQTPREIVIHHTGTKSRPDRALAQKMRGLQAFSQREDKVGDRIKPAWGDIPYHFYIDVSGEIGEGRRLEYAGDTNTAYDTQDKIQIALEGNFEEETPPAAQIAAMERLTLWLQARLGLPAGAVRGHSDLAETICPGRHLKPYVEALARAR